MEEKSFQASLQPEQIDAGQSASVKIQNNSSGEATYKLTFQSQDDELEFRLGNSRSLKIPEGETGSLAFSAVPRKPPWIGGSKLYPFIATIESESGEQQELEGELIGLALMPAWLAGIAVVLCLVITIVIVAQNVSLPTAVAQVTQTPAVQTAVATTVSGADPDGDGLTNEQEQEVGTDPNLPDTDNDRLNDGQEVNEYGTDPLKQDTDDDTIDDADEIRLGFDPLVADDTDGDRLLNGEELRIGTDPLNVDTDGDTFWDGDEVIDMGTDPLDANDPPAEATEAPGATPEPTTLPGVFNQGTIVFESDRDGNPEIYLLNLEDRTETRLTDDPGVDTQPTLSPDGTQIAFVSDRTGDRDVYLLNVDGSGLTNLTQAPADDEFPAWATNGRRLAFSSDRGGNQDVYVVDVPTSGDDPVSEPTQVTTSPADDYDPSWMGAQEMIFTSNRDGNQEIYWVSLDGSGPTNFTNNPAEDFGPSSNPNGLNFAFTTSRDGDLEVYIINLNRLDEPVNVTRLPEADDMFPGWSSDPSWIVFTSNRDGNLEVYGLNAVEGISIPGTQAYNVTNNPADDQFPDWFVR